MRSGSCCIKRIDSHCDVGEYTQEEIDAVKAGANYKWPTTDGPFSQTEFPNFVEPFYSYSAGAHATYGAAITGGAFYDPTTQLFPAGDRGDYLFVDYIRGWIKMLNLKTRTATTLVTGLTHPVDIDVAGNGSVYVLDYDDGKSGGTGSLYEIRT